MCKIRCIIRSMVSSFNGVLTLLHSEQPKLFGVLAVLSAVGIIKGVFKYEAFHGEHYKLACANNRFR